MRQTAGAAGGECPVCKHGGRSHWHHHHRILAVRVSLMSQTLLLIFPIQYDKQIHATVKKLLPKLQFNSKIDFWLFQSSSNYSSHTSRMQMLRNLSRVKVNGLITTCH